MNFNTTTECRFCGEPGHSNTECNHPDLHELWDDMRNLVSDYNNFNEETFEIQKNFLLQQVPHYLVIAIAIRFCDIVYTYECTFNDFIQSIYHGLKNYAELEIVFEEFDGSDVDIAEQIEPASVSQWIVEPFLRCIETAEELQEGVFCSICIDDHTRLSTVTTMCGHDFCKSCMCSHLDYQLADEQQPKCPMCRMEVTSLEIKDIEFYDELYDRYVTSRFAVPLEIEDLDSIADISLLDSFDFMPFIPFMPWIPQDVAA